MSTDSIPQDPFDVMKRLWNTMGLPGMMPPSATGDEIDRKIADLKSVESWLVMNLNVLQMSIKSLEVQKSTLEALKAMDRQNRADSGAPPNPFLNPALWPWSMMQAMSGAAVPPAAGSEDDRKPAAKKPKSQ